VDPEVLDSFAFEIHTRFSGKKPARRVPGDRPFPLRRVVLPMFRGDRS
jgi:hypothetical protein